MSADTVIADLPPEDGRNWECQCARCGSSASGWRAYDSHSVTYECLSSAEWCTAHPLWGREQVERGAIEWYTVDRAEGT